MSEEFTTKQQMELTYTAETQTLIGQQRRRLLDQDTGEVILVDQITKRAYGQKLFWKVYLMDFLAVLGILDSKQLEVLIYIVEHTAPASNLFIGTQRRIAAETGCSLGTVSKIVKKLLDHKFLTLKQTGVYMINPAVLMRGDEHKRQILLSYYQEDDSSDGQTLKVSGKRVERAEIPEQQHLPLEGGDIHGSAD